MMTRGVDNTPLSTVPSTRWHRHDVLDSTSLHARKLVAGDPTVCHVVIAATQTRGRGRLDRIWHSPRGGLWITVTWPHQAAPDQYSTLPLVAALALHQSLAPELDAATDALSIKWPNDLLLGGCKLAGMLCENLLPPDGSPGTTLVGVGVNANFPAAQLATGLRYPATTLQDTLGRPIDLDALAMRFVTTLQELVTAVEATGFRDVCCEAITQRLAQRGQVVQLGDGSRGRLRGITDDGALRLVDETTGLEHTHTLAEIVQSTT